MSYEAFKSLKIGDTVSPLNGGPDHTIEAIDLDDGTFLSRETGAWHSFGDYV